MGKATAERAGTVEVVEVGAVVMAKTGFGGVPITFGRAGVTANH